MRNAKKAQKLIKFQGVLTPTTCCAAKPVKITQTI